MNKEFKYQDHFNKLIDLMLEEDTTFQLTINKIKEIEQEGSILVTPLSYVRAAKAKHKEAYESILPRLHIWRYKNEQGKN